MRHSCYLLTQITAWSDTCVRRSLDQLRNWHATVAQLACHRRDDDDFDCRAARCLSRWVSGLLSERIEWIRIYGSMNTQLARAVALDATRLGLFTGLTFTESFSSTFTLQGEDSYVIHGLDCHDDYPQFLSLRWTIQDNVITCDHDHIVHSKEHSRDRDKVGLDSKNPAHNIHNPSCQPWITRCRQLTITHGITHHSISCSQFHNHSLVLTSMSRHCHLLFPHSSHPLSDPHPLSDHRWLISHKHSSHHDTASKSYQHASKCKPNGKP